jgi:hypothetical protein
MTDNGLITVLATGGVGALKARKFQEPITMIMVAINLITITCVDGMKMLMFINLFP